MYAQCDVDGNECLLLECFIDIQKDHTAISLDEQKAVHNGPWLAHVSPMEGWFHVMGIAIRCEGITPLTDG